ncbi:MAG: hypothetical protein QM667_04325 [Asticcacaulis sp.]
MRFIRKFTLAAASVAMMAVQASSAQAAGLSPFSPADEVVGYAVEQACFTWLRHGGALKDYVHRSSRTVRQPSPKTGDNPGSDKAEKLYGGGHVTVQEAFNGSCYIRGARGNGAAMRDKVLSSLRDMGFAPEAFADYSLAARNRDWSFLQESYCVRDADTVRIVLISSSASGARTPLQVSIMNDREGLAAKKGLCLG